MDTRNNSEEFTKAIVGFVLLAVLFMLGFVWNFINKSF